MAAGEAEAEQHRLVEQARGCQTKVRFGDHNLSFSEVIALDGETEQDKWIHLSLHQQAERAKFFLKLSGVNIATGGSLARQSSFQAHGIQQQNGEWWKSKQAQEGNMKATKEWCKRCGNPSSHEKHNFSALNCRSELRAPKAQSKILAPMNLDSPIIDFVADAKKKALATGIDDALPISAPRAIKKKKARKSSDMKTRDEFMN